jgi:hypothetical protein
MSIQEGFTFSQSSLQDFVDCRRRFQLRYLRRLAWPAVESEPVLEAERYQQQGALFHRLVQQHLVGVPAERLESMVAGDELEHWWANYLGFHKKLTSVGDLSGSAYPEISLSASLVGYRLEAKYDLVVLLPGERARIYDWKSGPRAGRQRPSRRWLAERLQTRLYPYLLVRAGAPLNAGKGLRPENVEMIYWFAGRPGQPEHFAYNFQAYQEDEAHLSDLIATIQQLEEGDFPLTSDLRHCAYCVYRSLCERGARAGYLDDADAELTVEEEIGFGLDFDQIAEIEF